jgi:hypothetical protein
MTVVVTHLNLLTYSLLNLFNNFINQKWKEVNLKKLSLGDQAPKGNIHLSLVFLKLEAIVSLHHRDQVHYQPHSHPKCEITANLVLLVQVDYQEALQLMENRATN